MSDMMPLSCRDQNVFSKLSTSDWIRYAGKVLAIDPTTDFILAIGESDAEIGISHQFSCLVVEFFHVPAVGSLSAR